MATLTIVLLIVASILAVVGVSVAVWSIFDTRKRYYDEYINSRHHNAAD